MKSNSLILGSHISLNKQNKYLLGVIEETIYNGANTFMIFTGAPHNKRRIPISEMYLDEAKELAKKHSIDFNKAVIHAPYIINLASPIEENSNFSVEQMVNEIKRTHEMGIPYIVLHPGYHVDQTWEEGMKRLIENLNKVLEQIRDYRVIICLETMPGKTNQLGSTLEELKMMIEGCNWDKQLGLCLDTVHMNDSGYDLSKKDNLLKKIDMLIGLDRVKVLHLGDSTGSIGSRKDIHANLDYGTIGFNTLIEWAYDPLFQEMPIIVETPFWVSKDNKKKLVSPYKHEIKLIREKKWEPIPAESNCNPR